MNEGGSLFIGGETVKKLQQRDAVLLFIVNRPCSFSVIADFLSYDHNGSIILLGKGQYIVILKADTPANFIGNRNSSSFAENALQLIHRHHPLRNIRSFALSGIRRSRGSSKDSLRSHRYMLHRSHPPAPSE